MIKPNILLLKSNMERYISNAASDLERLKATKIYHGELTYKQAEAYNEVEAVYLKLIQALHDLHAELL